MEGGLTKQRKLYPGCGGLFSKRVLTYLEGSGLFGGVLEPYIKLEAGSKCAFRFLAAVASVEEGDVKESAFMAALKEMLETEDSDGRKPLEAAVYRLALGAPALRGLEDACAALCSGLWTGGALETLMCDVIWRCWRPINGILSTKYKQWSSETSAGTPLNAVPIFRASGAPATEVDFRRYLQVYLQGARQQPRRRAAGPTRADTLRALFDGEAAGPLPRLPRAAGPPGTGGSARPAAAAAAAGALAARGNGARPRGRAMPGRATRSGSTPGPP